MSPDPLIVNLEDPADVERVFARVARILKVKRDEAQGWESRVNGLAMFLPPDHPAYMTKVTDALLDQLVGARSGDDVPQPAPEREREPVRRAKAGEAAQDLAVAVLEREPRKLRAKDVHQILRSEGHDVDYDQVNNGLYYAATKAREKRIWKPPGRGFYAPLSYKEEVIFDSSNGGESTSSSPEGRTVPAAREDGSHPAAPT